MICQICAAPAELGQLDLLKKTLKERTEMERKMNMIPRRLHNSKFRMKLRRRPSKNAKNTVGAKNGTSQEKSGFRFNMGGLSHTKRIRASMDRD